MLETNNMLINYACGLSKRHRQRYPRERLRRLQEITMIKMMMTRTMTVPAATAPAIHATDSDNQPSVAAAVSVVTAAAAGHRQKHRFKGHTH